MGIIFFEILEAGSIPAALNVIIEKLSAFATSIKIPAVAFFALGAIAAVLLGIWGYRYIKFIATACFALAGFGFGSSLFEVAKARFEWNVPDFVGTIAGVAILVLLGYLAYKKFAYALFGVACFAGFLFAYFIYPNYIIAISVGVIVAMVSMHFVRYAFVVITSFAGGYLLLGMLSAILPHIAFLKLDKGFVGMFLCVVVSLFFVSIQLHSSGKDVAAKKLFGGPRRVKIRRVFDVW